MLEADGLNAKVALAWKSQRQARDHKTMTSTACFTVTSTACFTAVRSKSPCQRSALDTH